MAGGVVQGEGPEFKKPVRTVMVTKFLSALKVTAWCISHMTGQFRVLSVCKALCTAGNAHVTLRLVGVPRLPLLKLSSDLPFLAPEQLQDQLLEGPLHWASRQTESYLGVGH
jgi:hypothetical protein